MIFEKVVSQGIAQNSYLVGSGGEAAVIDPRRDIGVYLEIAQENGLRISHAFETHRNEDYLIGSLELARVTGCEIPPRAEDGLQVREPGPRGRPIPDRQPRFSGFRRPPAIQKRASPSCSRIPRYPRLP